MNQDRVSDEDLKSYLLDSLPQPARARLEERYLSDDETYERLLAMEEEIMDDHVQGLLSPRQWEPLKRSLLLGKDGPERLRFAQTLAQVRSQTRPSFPRRLAAGLQLFTRRRALIPAAIGGIALLVFLAVLPEGARRQSTNRANDGTGQPLITGESVDGAPAPTVTLLLHPVGRDSSAANILRISRPQDRIRLEAELAGDERNSYDVTVRRVDGGQAQTPLDIRQRFTKSGTVLISAGFSAGSLRDGDYIFTVFAANADHPSEELLAYTFTVVHTPLS